MQHLDASKFAASMVALYIFDMETIQARLNALFAEAHEPKDQKVGDEAGVSQETIYRVRHGATLNPSMPTLRKLANYFRVNIDWLANGVGPKRGLGKSDITPVTAEFLKHFESLPDAFKTYLVSKAQGLRQISEEMKPIVRKSLSSPADPDRYKEWERGIDEMLQEREGE